MTPEKLATTIKRLYPLLAQAGPPDEVLPAVLFICAEQSQSSGNAPEVFFTSVLAAVNMVWGPSIDPQKMAQAIADWAMQDAAENRPMDAYEQALVTGIRNAKRKGKA